MEIEFYSLADILRASQATRTTKVLLLGVTSCCFPQDYGGPSPLLTPYCSLDCNDKSAHTFNKRREVRVQSTGSSINIRTKQKDAAQKIRTK